MKEIAQRIFRRTLASIDVSAALSLKLDRSGSLIRAGDERIDLRKYARIAAIAFGKASLAMASSLGELLPPETPFKGILVVPQSPPRAMPGWQIFTGGHPVPTAASFAAGRAILDCLHRCDDCTLVFFLLSGGGSSLVEYPLDPRATLEDFQKMHTALVTCGANIEEINTIRKHVSATKGGRLAAAAPRSKKITYAISDVPEGQESSLASGPTLPDPSTAADAAQIVAQYRLLERFSPLLRAAFESHELPETPKADDPAFDGAHFVRLLGTHELFHAAHHACEALGFECLCDNSTDNWPLEKAANQLLADLQMLRNMYPGKPVAILADGELSSPVKGAGVGGRNAAFVLTCVPKIAGTKIAVLSAGTDGIDGNSPAAGAVADGDTLERARALGLEPVDFLARSDSWNYFTRLRDAVTTGPTGNNLRDLRILLWRD